MPYVMGFMGFMGEEKACAENGLPCLGPTWTSHRNEPHGASMEPVFQSICISDILITTRHLPVRWDLCCGYKKGTNGNPWNTDVFVLSQVLTSEVGDWRKNVEAMSGMEGRKKMFDTGGGGQWKDANDDDLTAEESENCVRDTEDSSAYNYLKHRLSRGILFYVFLNYKFCFIISS